MLSTVATMEVRRIIGKIPLLQKVNASKSSINLYGDVTADISVSDKDVRCAARVLEPGTGSFEESLIFLKSSVVVIGARDTVEDSNDDGAPLQK